jgi:hypothetical protein
MNNLKKKDKMIRKFIIDKHVKVIFEEMCRRVGTELSKVDILQTNWQENFQWTIEEERDFASWLFDYLVKNREALQQISTFRETEHVSTKDLTKLIQEFTLLYGWALKDEIDLDQITENNPEKN